MTVDCVSCERFTLRDSQAWAVQGFGRCSGPNSMAGKYVSSIYKRICSDHQPVAADKAAARIEWLRDVRTEGA